jgi:hypothetical protein
MTANGENGFEIKAHEGTYSGFTALMKWGTIISFIVAALVVLIIAS